jgi:hypothetical protein
MHPLDGQNIGFGDHGVLLEEVPSPWLELLNRVGETFSFEQHSERWSWVYGERI